MRHKVYRISNIHETQGIQDVKYTWDTRYTGYQIYMRHKVFRMLNIHETQGIQDNEYTWDTKYSGYQIYMRHQVQGVQIYMRHKLYQGSNARKVNCSCVYSAYNCNGRNL